MSMSIKVCFCFIYCCEAFNWANYIALYSIQFSDMIRELTDQFTLQPNESHETKEHFIKVTF